jgi:hypothetical protein
MRYTTAILTSLVFLAPHAAAQDWSAEDVFGDLAPHSQPVPVIPGVPAPPNYYGNSGSSYRNGYTVIETETTKVDPFKAATGFMDPTYTERRIQVVPNNSMGQPIVPFRLAP